MIRQVEVKEIVVGVSNQDNILNVLNWFWDCWRNSQHRYHLQMQPEVELFPRLRKRIYGCNSQPGL